MNKPKNIDEAIARARKYGTPTYMMLADEVERMRMNQCNPRQARENNPLSRDYKYKAYRDID